MLNEWSNIPPEQLVELTANRPIGIACTTAAPPLRAMSKPPEPGSGVYCPLEYRQAYDERYGTNTVADVMYLSDNESPSFIRRFLDAINPFK